MPVEQTTQQDEELKDKAIEWYVSEQIKKQMIAPASRERAIVEIKDALRPEEIDRITADYQHLKLAEESRKVNAIGGKVNVEHPRQDKDKEAKAIAWYIDQQIGKGGLTSVGTAAAIDDGLGKIGSKGREVRVSQILTDYDNAHGGQGRY